MPPLIGVRGQLRPFARDFGLMFPYEGGLDDPQFSLDRPRVQCRHQRLEGLSQMALSSWRRNTNNRDARKISGRIPQSIREIEIESHENPLLGSTDFDDSLIWCRSQALVIDGSDIVAGGQENLS